MAQLLLGDLDLLAGAYRAKVGTSFGMWQAVTTTTDSLFLDGSVVSGEQSGNRTVALQVRVETKPRSALIAACEALFAEANKAANTLTFVPDEGLPVVYEVFRAQPERTDDESETLSYRRYTLTFPALPFTRSTERVMPTALAPALVLEDFEGTFTGLALGTVFYDATFGTQYVLPTTAYQAPVDFKDAPALAPDTNCGALTTSSINGHRYDGYTYSENRYGFTATASGDVILRTAGTWAVTGDVVSACVGFFKNSGKGWMAGIEFLTSSGASLGTTWGPDMGSNAPSGVEDSFAAWVTAVVPAGAASYRVRSRLTSCVAGQTYYVTTRGYAGAQASVGDADRRVIGAGYHGAKGMTVSVQTSSTALTDENQTGGSVYGILPAPLDVSDQPYISVQVNGAAAASNGAFVSLRLYDTAGRFSRWNMPLGSVAVSGWTRLAAPLGAPPDAIGPGGAADLTSISAWILDQGQAVSSFDYVIAGPAPSPFNSTRGTVFDLDDIVGSARTTTKVALSTTAAATDFLVAVAEPDVLPMLAVASSVATAAAPAAYGAEGDRVYRIIGCLAPASAEVNPTCVVNQLIGGVSVASQTLTGRMQAGNHYCDFGTVGLPLVGTPAENQAVSYTFTLAPADTDWAEVLVLDVDQPLAWLSNLSPTRAFAWIDEPEPTAQLGRVWVGSAADRSDARSPTTPPDLSRPFQVRSPGVRLLAYSTSGAPNVSLSYYPRWLVEPTA